MNTLNPEPVTSTDAMLESLLDEISLITDNHEPEAVLACLLGLYCATAKKHGLTHQAVRACEAILSDLKTIHPPRPEGALVH